MGGIFQSQSIDQLLLQVWWQSQSPFGTPVSQPIPLMKSSSGALIIDPVEINSIFKSYYSSLYMSEVPGNSDNMMQFLDHLDISTIESTLAEQIDAPRNLRLEMRLYALLNHYS